MSPCPGYHRDRLSTESTQGLTGWHLLFKLAATRVQKKWRKHRINQGIIVKLPMCQRVVAPREKTISGKWNKWLVFCKLLVFVWQWLQGSLWLRSTNSRLPPLQDQSFHLLPGTNQAREFLLRDVLSSAPPQCGKITDNLMIFSTDVIWCIGWLCAFS